MSKIAFVTGGSSGIGAAISQKLLSMGCTVIVASRRASSSPLVKEKQSIPLDVDLSDIQSSTEKVNQVLSENHIGNIDILVNCAGMGFGTPLKDLDEQTFERMISLNVKGVFFLTKALLPYLRKNSIICNISSIAGIRGFPEWSVYCASKFAIEGFSKALRHELREQGIKVMVVRPGAVDTPLYDFLDEKEKGGFMKPSTLADVIIPNFFLEDNATTEEIFINNTVGDI